MDVYVIGVGLHPPAPRVAGKRLEEMVYDTARSALDDAGVERAALDNVTIAGCDELDGRSISSMLLAMPAGAYLKDEIKATDAGLVGFCLGAARMASGPFGLGMVVSWCKPSTAPVEDVMRMRCEPFFTRPVGLNMTVADALFAGAAMERWGFGEDDADAAALRLSGAGARNPRGAGAAALDPVTLEGSPYVAHPLRRAQQAPMTDGAAALVLATGDWLAAHPEVTPLARVAGLGWRTDAYDLGRERLADLGAFRASMGAALDMAGLDAADELDAVELDAQTGFHAAAFARALEDMAPAADTPSGGPWAQNPYFCTGLVNAAEAVLQVAGRARGTQIPNAHLAAAHGCHGFAQQGHAVAVFEGCGA